MPSPRLNVLYEDNHCLAVSKPARMLTAGDRSGDESLLDLAKAWLKKKYDKPGNVFLGLVHRLDRPVSGVIVFARTSKAAARLSDQFRKRTVHKVYHAIVEGHFAETEGELHDWLVKDEQSNTVRAVSSNHEGARHCVLRFRRLKAGRGVTLIEVTPVTGRSHQIRVQLAHRGHPIYGDRKYGSKRSLGGAIALHSAELTFEHPTRREPITVAAPTPADWQPLISGP